MAHQQLRIAHISTKDQLVHWSSHYIHKYTPLISYAYVRIPIKLIDLWLDFVCTGTFGIQGWSVRKTGDFGLYVTRGVLSGAKWSFDKKSYNRRFNSTAWPQNQTAVFFQRYQVQNGGHTSTAEPNRRSIPRSHKIRRFHSAAWPPFETADQVTRHHSRDSNPNICDPI